MKAFLSSALALILLCALVIWNGIFISDVTRDMKGHAEKIDSIEDISELEKLEELWEKNKFIICISVPHRETDELEKNLQILRTKLENKTDTELAETVSLTVKAIDEIEIHGALSIDTVF